MNNAINTLTDTQQQAVEATGNVLVVAGAGTGKTSTLIERCRRLVLEQNCSLDRMLLVTFTEAAAAEMRQRLRQALLDALEQTPDHERLTEQLALLDTAYISTLHGFCRHLVSEHFDTLGIDPEVTVLDEQQTQPLIQETLDTLFNRWLEEDSPRSQSVQTLVRSQGRGATEVIRGLILRLHRYTQSLADPAAWFDHELARFREPEPRQWRQWLAAGALDWAQRWLPTLRQMAAECPFASLSADRLEELRQHPALTEPASFATAEAFQPVQSWLGQLLSQIAEADQEKANWPRGRKTALRAPLKKLFSDLEFLQSQTTGTASAPDPLAQDWQWVAPAMVTLLELAQEFHAQFSQAKRDVGGVDFADLEQFALRLLRDAAGQPSAIAQRWQERFAHVFVDEYQDINAAQDAILTALSRTGNQANRFLVGDVKQSIYRFRRANPRIFQHYEQSWRQHDSAGTCLALSDNFRSREGLLACVNDVFEKLMRPGIGGLTYDTAAALQFGNRAERSALALPPAPDHDPRVELHLLTQTETTAATDFPAEEADDTGSALEDLLAVEKEARAVALRLRQLKDQNHPVWDAAKNDFRPVAWSDMAVLLRSPANKVEAYAKAFHQTGVPLIAPRGGFFAALEVLDLLNLLKLLDNPLQDVPLLAVLRSPLVGLALEEWVAIRAASDQVPFWRALHAFQKSDSAAAESEAALRAKVDRFLHQFAAWRELVRQSSLSHCLETALADTHYEALLLAEERGPERVANVRRFLDLARQYDPYQRQGLFRFLRFIAAQQETEVDLEPAPVQAADAVQLMSIHKSKGLEFPVVVVADLGKRFNLDAVHQDILLDEHYGLCPRIAPPDLPSRYSSLPRWLAQKREHQEALGEELRLLYVAMTRARDTLILTATLKDRRDNGRWQPAASPVIPDPAILDAGTAWQWLRLWLEHAAEPVEWLNEQTARSRLWRCWIYTENDPRLAIPHQSANSVAEPEFPILQLDDAHLAMLGERIDWQYPLAMAAAQPAKQSVTALARRQREAEEDAQPWMARGGIDACFRLKQPVREGARLSAADIGTAHHQFLQRVALDRVDTLDALRAEARRLEQTGWLSPAQTAALNLESLAQFWSSDCGRRIQAHAEWVRREVPFTARMQPAELRAAGLSTPETLPAEEFIVIQGVVDLAVIQPDEIWILDFKTDAITASEIAGKKTAYGPQLALYAQALHKIYRRPVAHRWLHFLAINQTEPI